MDELFKALLRLATDKGWSKAELARRVGEENPQAMTNWKKRGVPQAKRAKIVHDLELPPTLLHPGFGALDAGSIKRSGAKKGSAKMRSPAGTDPLDSLIARFEKSDPATQALIRIALDDPDAPLPKSIRPSLKSMIDMVRAAVRPHLTK